MHGWKSITVFGIMLAAYILKWEELDLVVDPEWIARGTVVVGLALRAITKTPIFKSAAD